MNNTSVLCKLRNQPPELHNALHYVILTSFGTQIPILKADHFIAITLSMYTVISDEFQAI